MKIDRLIGILSILLQKEKVTAPELAQVFEENGYRNDFRNDRLHHEIYMSDARKVAPEKWKTVIRHPICKKEA